MVVKVAGCGRVKEGGVVCAPQGVAFENAADDRQEYEED